MNINPLSQRDKRWANKLLGFNVDPIYAIKDWGCLITCLAMVANYHNENSVEDPFTINEALKKVNGFSGGGNYVWGAISRVFSTITERLINTPQVLNDTQMSEIRGALLSGHPVMLQIDFIPETSRPDMHYVLAVNWNENDEDDITINDPWYGDKRSLKSYLKGSKTTARKSIEQYVIYTSNTSMGNDLEEENAKLQKRILELEVERDKWREHYKDLEQIHTDQVKSKDEQIKGLQEIISGLNTKVLSLETALHTNKTPLSEYTVKEKIASILSDLLTSKRKK